MQIEKYIEYTNSAKDVDTLFGHYEQAMDDIGFDRVIFSLMTDHPTLKKDAVHGVVRNYPEHWMDYYLSAGYEDIDPVRQAMFSSDRIFKWSDVLTNKHINEKQVQLMFEGKESGLNSGVGIPLRSNGFSLAGVGAASTDRSLEVTEFMMCYASMLSKHFYDCYLRLSTDIKSSNDNYIYLTDREKKVLKYCADGYKRKEVGERLCISPSTVDFHIKNIHEKLGTRSIVDASVQAVKRSLINI